MRNGTKLRAALLAGSVAFLAGCDEANMPGFLQNKDGGGASVASAQKGSTRLVERDVEAPEVFQKSEAGLWDGRPSLGGVWVAHPDVGDPERVIIRNEANGKFVIGALFRREREQPGPRFQVSSDAADALGMLAGAPADLSVTALKREEVAEEPEIDEAETVDTLPDAGEVEATTLDPLEAAAAALDKAEGTTSAAAPAASAPAMAASSVAPTPAPAPKPQKSSSLDKPYIQIGIFSVKANAENTAASMRANGMVPTVKEGSTSGKKFWRVIVGPATTSAERSALLKKIKDLGFTDAYFVSN